MWFGASFGLRIIWEMSELIPMEVLDNVDELAVAFRSQLGSLPII